MRKIFVFSTAVALMAFAATPQAAHAQNSRTLTGAAIGAGSGALIAGPPGAVVGGVVGAIVGGPAIRGHTYQRCWINKYGQQRCRWVR